MAKKILIHFLALIVFLFCVGPLLLTLFGGIIPDAALLSYPPKWFSMKPSFAYYKYIFFGVVPSAYEERGAMRSMITEEARQIPHSMMNSAIIALSVMGINILFGGMAAFAFARIRFKGKSTTFMGIVMCRLLPAAAFVVPFYLIVQSLGLLDTKIAIILVHSILTLPFTVLILSVFFRKIPVDIEEAATVDGASRPQIFLKITLPLSAASMVATGLFAFMLSYSEFLYSLILSGTDKTRTLSVAMAALSTNTDVAWGMLMAGIFITLIPSLILAILVWKFVVEGIILGAVKY
ncbi:MAG: carbohydrate ABC transporter permease [Planctomycetota bacterium]|jgi:ABC-type glycerol-3-phosphate transport system permease component